MNTHKRDRAERAFERGFKAGVRGRSATQCPYISLLNLRGVWLGGWRLGREQYLYGTVKVING